MTLDSLREQIVVQKKLEKILADKIVVSTEEVDQYIENNSANVPSESMEEYRTYVEDQLRQQKLASEVAVLIDSLHSEANIEYFKEY